MITRDDIRAHEAWEVIRATLARVVLPLAAESIADTVTIELADRDLLVPPLEPKTHTTTRRIAS